MKSFWRLLITGLLIRLIISFSTFHSDTVAFELGGKVVSSGNIFNLYDYSSEKAVFNYPPAIYWFHGIFHPFIPFSNYGFVKLPYLIFDFLIAFILIKFFQKEQQKLALIFWIFNPINLYSTYMMGQFDIIPTFFTLLSLYFISKNKLSFAALALGGGIAFKLYPIFLVFPLIILGKGIWAKIKLLALSFLPYLISIMPYIFLPSFRSQALFANQSSKSLYAALVVSGGESILLFPAALLFFYLIIHKKPLDISNAWRYYLIPLLLFFIFTHYHPQWLIWITPLIIFDLIIEKFDNLFPTALIFLSWIGSLFFFDPLLTIGLFSPIWPDLQNTPSIWNLLNIGLDYNFARSVLQTIFAASSLYLIYYHLKVSKR